MRLGCVLAPGLGFGGWVGDLVPWVGWLGVIFAKVGVVGVRKWRIENGGLFW
jgi:hypothetical protein